MNELCEERLLTFGEAARMVPPVKGRACHTATIYRWALRGCRLPDGSRVRLEYFRRGGQRLTSAEALERFFQRLRDGDAPGEAAPAPAEPAAPRRRPAQRRLQIAAADARCRAAGL